jgi:hypothetical protein
MTLKTMTLHCHEYFKSYVIINLLFLHFKKVGVMIFAQNC